MCGAMEKEELKMIPEYKDLQNKKDYGILRSTFWKGRVYLRDTTLQFL